MPILGRLDTLNCHIHYVYIELKVLDCFKTQLMFYLKKYSGVKHTRRQHQPVQPPSSVRLRTSALAYLFVLRSEINVAYKILK